MAKIIIVENTVKALELLREAGMETRMDDIVDEEFSSVLPIEEVQ